jgi:hypothetical protein
VYTNTRGYQEEKSNIRIDDALILDVAIQIAKKLLADI